MRARTEMYLPESVIARDRKRAGPDIATGRNISLSRRVTPSRLRTLFSDGAAPEVRPPWPQPLSARVSRAIIVDRDVKFMGNLHSAA